MRPCRSPYCECERDKCTHPGCYDARHLSTADKSCATCIHSTSTDPKCGLCAGPTAKTCRYSPIPFKETP